MSEDHAGQFSEKTPLREGFSVVGDQALKKNASSGDDDETAHIVSIEGYRQNPIKAFFFYLGSFFSVGILLLLSKWFTMLGVRGRKSRSTLRDADTVAITAVDGSITLCDIMVPDTGKSGWRPIGDEDFKNDDIERMFSFRHLRHFLIDDCRSYEALEYSVQATHFSIQERNSTGLDRMKAAVQTQRFGRNLIEVNVPSIPKILMDEVLHPFYLFQIYSFSWWFWENYYYYCVCLIVMTIISLIAELVETRRNWTKLREMAHLDLAVRVMRDGALIDVTSQELVPGDVMEISTGMILPCDAVLLQGATVVNEAMLTGESVPVLKNALNKMDTSTVYLPASDKRYTLFCGTQVLQTRCSDASLTKALVIRTGYDTAKGKLVRSILFPKPHQFSFYRDSFRFIGGLFGIGLIGMIFSVVYLEKSGADVVTIIQRVGDLLTIIVPPALPACMTIGISFALSRLKTHGIFCIAPTRINVSGNLHVFCFDKTGTLTEDGLDLVGIQPALNSRFEELQPEASRVNDTLIQTLASCHSLTIVDEKLIGDPLEVRLFEATSWKLDEQGQTTHVSPPSLSAADKLTVVRRFDFTSQLQRMSVCVRNNAGEMTLFAKGAPEVIRDLSIAESVPTNFSDLLHDYTTKGMRVLACGYKRVEGLSQEELEAAKRDHVETGLVFLGFIIMHNKIKPESRGSIAELNAANIRCVMVTGDHALTAVCVARECEILPHEGRVLLAECHDGVTVQWTNADEKASNERTLTTDEVLGLHANSALAVTGRAFHVLRERLSKRDLGLLMVRAQVFARMSPEQKAQLVDAMAEIDFITGMCGDGANDCGALKAAHVGISLSEAEASIAAPFTSKTPNISCTLQLIMQGRCALMTSIQCFKFMALYSLTQFISAAILYTINSNLGDLQYLWIDLFAIIPLAVTMTRTHPYPTLQRRRPVTSLFSAPIFSSILGQVILQLGFQIFVRLWLAWYLSWQPGYTPLQCPDDFNCVETTTIFLFANFQYIAVACAFNISQNFRKSPFTNWMLVIAVISLFTIDSVILLVDWPWFQSFFKLVGRVSTETHTGLPQEFRWMLWGVAIANFAATMIYERVFVIAGVLPRFIKWLRRALCRCCAPSPLQFKRLQREPVGSVNAV
eukprot:TRINITY_DN12710_c0_g1_i1.p1 TRINITY_DN12710_c0_g1~~TRINITY_DN12710_c0_g1_i1.p1  ORF type:complete len:1132 (-),score=273.59 TRINITY_DN12710_c0_g1_i1:2313-5708(-)